jgi:hypothetical protein
MNTIVSQILRHHGANSDTFRVSKHVPTVSYGYVPGSNALALWEELRGQFSKTGIWPIIRGGKDEEAEEYPFDAFDMLSKVPAGTVWQLLASRLTERVETYATFIDGLDPHDDLEKFIAKVDASGAMSFGGKIDQRSPWPTNKAEAQLAIHSILDMHTSQPRRLIRIALLELQHPQEAPAYLGFGGWNDSPMPELQVAMLREWHRAYGAVPIAITGDVMECVVDRPPQTESEAMALAAEQWIFCDDIVGQGTQTVRRLGIEIWRSPHWFFWWD